MIPTRCQLCGRRKWLRKNGTIVHHHVAGDPCPGAGHPPIEHDDARLIGYVAELAEKIEAIRLKIRALEEARANWIDPALGARRAYLAGEWLKYDRRLMRHQRWAERYERTYDRQMMTQGYVWADKPPEYLISRHVAKKGWIPAAFR